MSQITQEEKKEKFVHPIQEVYTPKNKVRIVTAAALFDQYYAPYHSGNGLRGNTFRSR